VAFNRGTDKDTKLAFQGNNPKHPDVIDFAGDFVLKDIVLINHEGDAIDIKFLVQEINVYESIYNNSITGTVVVTDATNLINNLPIQGTERLSFKLKTPGTDKQKHTIDCSQETGHPVHIFKLTHRQQLESGVQMYILHFCSREFLRNMRTRVSKSYSGTIDTMVNSILGDKDGLDTRKTVTTQKTRNSDKIVIPNKQPFDAIDMLCKRALADNSKSVGYYFYETTKGFQFRSWESMCVDDKGIARPAKQKFAHKVMNTETMEGPRNQYASKKDKFLDGYESVEDYNFITQGHDVSTNTMMGTYGHRVITHNIFNKSYKIDDYHYHNRFSESKHLDGDNPAIVASPVDWDTTDDASGGHKGVSDYPESRVTVMPTTQYAHGEETGHFGTEVGDDGIFEGARISQSNQVVAGTRLEMTVKGQSYLSAGDVIDFKHRAIDHASTEGEVDRQYSGRYIITAIRHKTTNTEYKCILECSKDSVYRAFPTSYKSEFYATANSEQPTYEDIEDSY
jgi:hypothetical protein|tara:strand:+ start:120 stop:1646 length:1527 start_codon:yes stop_codon:yes gene_type:complete